MGFAAALLLAALAVTSAAQETGAAPAATAAAALPDAPAPQMELADAGQAPAQNAQPSAPSTASSTGVAEPESRQPGNAPQGSSSSQAAQQPQAQESQHKKAAEQVREEEKQRVAGIVPAFNVSYRSDAVSLSAGQKISLAFRSAVDPFTFAAAFLVAGLHEGLDQDTGFGWGAEGYFKRSGAAYLDAFDGEMIGNGILPVMFHQDPRYFRLGHGSFHHRLFYALATSYVCKHDNSGRWEPNYSNVIGNVAAGALSNLYYPSEESGWGQTVSNGFIVTTEGTAGGVFQEFWPDVSRKLFHKDPTHGLDAQAAARDQAEKQSQGVAAKQ